MQLKSSTFQCAPIFMVTILLGFFTSCSDILQYEEGHDVQNTAKPFEWTRSSDRSTHYAFVRNYGVGYSYNAVSGDYCNWNDIRCQIVNRGVLERLKEDNNLLLYGGNHIQKATQSTQFTFNQRDYVAGIHLSTDQEIDLGLYNNTKRKRQDVLEDGLQEKFYYTVDRTITMGNQWIAEADIRAYVSQGNFEYMFTESFRNAVEHMKHAIYEEEHDEQYLEAVVDSFVNIYGTHVITRASLGGKLRLDLSNSIWRYNDRVKEEEWSLENILWAYSQRKENRKDSIYQYIESSSINVSAYGGDQSYLTGILGKTNYDGSRTFSTDPIKKWQNSLKLDLDDESNSNVELIDMQVRPIWDFIAAIDPYEELTERIKNHICQDISYQQSQLGVKNFFNTTFAVQYENPKVKTRNEAGEYTIVSSKDLDVPYPCVNIVSDGRFVATVVREVIQDSTYQVAYPIYDGKASFYTGIAVKDGKAYKLKWSKDHYILTKLSKEDTPQTANFYINEGALSLKRQESLSYSESHPMLYMEACGGVKPDGSFCMGAPLLPTKNGLDFFIKDSSITEDTERPIGWSWDNVSNCYKRDSTYTYIYNPTEMNYTE